MIKKIISMISIGILIIVFTTETGLAGGVSRFSLDISDVETKWLYQNAVIKTKITSLTAIKTESIAEQLEGSLVLGIQELKQTANSLAAAQNTSGYYAGIGLSYYFLMPEKNKLFIFTQYQYHQLAGNDVDQQVGVTWYDFSLGITNYYSITKKIRLLLNASYISVNGSQQALEPLSETINFENNSDENYGVGIEFSLSSKGYIAVNWLAGANEGFLLSFARNF